MLMMESLKFRSFNLSDKLSEGLEKQNFIQTSDIQAKCLPVLLKGENVLGLAPTGTGKTLAYLVPIINNLKAENHLQAIIISPTVALANQIQNVAQSLLSALGYPNDSLKLLKSKKDINKSDPLIIITTLSQLKEIYSRYPINHLRYVIIDEGDMISFDGFNQELNSLRPLINKGLVSFFSASLNIQDIRRVKSFFRIKNVFDVRNMSITSENVKHHFVNFRSENKTFALKKLLDYLNPYKAIVFVSTKNELYTLSRELKRNNIDFLLLSGDLDKRNIRQIIDAFKKSSNKLLLASDYASRGLDIPDVDLVISYDLPRNNEYYFHRAGRSGRYLKPGDSYIMYSEDDEDSTNKLKALIKRGISGDLLTISKNGIKISNGIYTFKNLGKKDQSNEKLQKQIRHAIMKTKSDKVKPGYKKKVKNAVDKVKRKHRMKVVRTNIARSGGNPMDYHED